MIDFDSKLYKAVSAIIEKQREENVSWDKIFKLDFCPGHDLQSKISFLSMMIGSITIEQWQKIVENEKNEEENGMNTTVVLCPSVTIPSNVNDFNYELDLSYGSAWSSYARKLKEKNFDEVTIHSIENASQKVLNKISLDTRDSGPLKGLVIGNVQSGKTANMAALMAMAADQGWNMFIILSGTIENLRIQTQDRLISDLNGATNVSWIPIERVDTHPSFIYALSKLSLNDESPNKYLMVCLKNSTRLKNLLNWLAKDTKNREKLKILFIDDEADQAGVNAAPQNKNDPSQKERTKINQSIVNLFTNKDGNGKEVSTKFRALDYVAYTATPYANILNEKPGEESIYPANFVSCLSVSNSYFGPQHIFGIEGTDCDGMDVINIIDSDEVDEIKELSPFSKVFPKQLEKAILWFYCCLATQRVKKVDKPFSMLIHTSQKQVDHERVAAAIKHWFNSFGKLDFIMKCREVYQEQTSKFTKNDFYKAYPNYSNKNIDDYLPFESISNELVSIFDYDINSIKINENKDFTYTKGVHLCIDNCSHNYIENNEYIRLLYPQKKLGYASGFIVVGGATLSRGLTIEGLVSTYFLRTVKQADTLMQMGRWFGYRMGYELLQRVWLTQTTISQFKFLSILDYELRIEMKNMQDSGLSPSLVGIKVKYYPKRNFLELTSKNKMKSAIPVEIDFSGVSTQTTIFYSSEEKLKKNYDSTEDLILKLGKPIDLSSHVKSNNYICWTGVDNDTVIDYITNLEYPKNEATFLDVKLFKIWYEKIASKIGLNKWNVVVAGLDNASKDKQFEINELKICKINRSKKNTINDGLIRIGALRAPKDWYVDIDPYAKGLDDNDRELMKKSATDSYKSIRKKAGLTDTSLLVIYFIDKDSKPRNGEIHRVAMDTSIDVVGISLVIPDSSNEYTGKSYLSIDLSNNDLELEEVDIDDED